MRVGPKRERGAGLDWEKTWQEIAVSEKLETSLGNWKERGTMPEP